MRIREATIVAWRKTAVEWRAIRLRSGSIEATGSGEISRPDLPQGSAESPDLLLAKIGGPHSASLHVLFPAREALLQLIDLPEADPDELRSMAALQMDKLSPFPPDQTVSSAEGLGKDPATGRVRVLGATVPRTKTRSVLDAAEQSGRSRLRLDLDILAWWRLMHDAEAVLPAGREWHLCWRDDDIWMLCCTDGLPDLLRVLAGPFSEDSAIREEILYALASRGIETAEAPDRVILWTETSEQAQRLTEALPEGPIPAASRRNDELPPLVEGGARRVFSVGMCMDLVSPDWAGRQHARRNVRRLVRTAGVVASFWLIALAMAYAALGLQRRDVRRLESEVIGLEGPAGHVHGLLERARSLENYADRSRSAIEAMREVVRLLPEDVTLTRFDYRKNRGIDLSGEAVDPEPIYEFIARMESSPLFDTVRPGRIEPRRGEEGLLQFPVSALLRGGS